MSEGDENLGICTLLVEAGANPTVLTDEGYAPLHLAVLTTSYKTINLLIKSGARFDQETTRGETLLDLILKFDNYYKVCAYFLRFSNFATSVDHPLGTIVVKAAHFRKMKSS